MALKLRKPLQFSDLTCNNVILIDNNKPPHDTYIAVYTFAKLSPHIKPSYSMKSKTFNDVLLLSQMMYFIMVHTLTFQMGKV